MTEDELTEQLVAAGHLLPQPAPGVGGTGPVFEAVVDGIVDAVHDAAAPERPRRLRFPAVTGEAVTRQAGYFESFPQLVGAVSAFGGDADDHARAVRDGTDLPLGRTAYTMVNAACHPVYRAFCGTAVDAVRVDLVGECFRHEPSGDPMRRVSFRMHEQVYLGSADGAASHAARWLAIGQGLLSDLGLDVKAEDANDPFFGRAGRILARSQRESGLKTEVTCAVLAGMRTPLASANLHGTHFGASFDITLADGSPAHSACFGVGLERATVALFATHGTDVGRWPAYVRKRLGLAT